MSELEPAVLKRIQNLMGEGFHDDEIRDQLLDELRPAYRSVIRVELEAAIAEARHGFTRSQPGRPSVSRAVHEYRWHRAAAAAGSTSLAAVARHYRMQDGTDGLVEERLAEDPNMLQSRVRHLRRLQARFAGDE